ncbi:DUF6894 family protein [Methylobacterium sp. WCS2018Hpa-22]|uniref:DUF6894 family protein n=1 Tax=Methylobacterium sp. WCS2018Hpa-22 TaxID=3073633 RepID=UPI00288B05B4|nr:hypothetical protein [Methylobacterium sp. WCS2018Hpa-22]
MSRLYFDFDDGRSRFKDDEGMDFPNAEAGRTEALKTLAEIAKDAIPRSDHQAISAVMRDDSGATVYSAEVTVSGEWHKPPS